MIARILRLLQLLLMISRRVLRVNLVMNKWSDISLAGETDHDADYENLENISLKNKHVKCP